MSKNTDIKERRLNFIAVKTGVAVKTIKKLLRDNGYFDNNNAPKKQFIDDGKFAMTSTEFLSVDGARQATKLCVEIKDGGMNIIDRLVTEYKKQRKTNHVVRSSKVSREQLWAELNYLWAKANHTQKSMLHGLHAEKELLK